MHSTEDVAWVISSHETVYEEQFGWKGVGEFVEQSIAEVLGTSESGRGWIAWRANERVGCVFSETSDDGTTVALRMLYANESARGLRVGSQLTEVVIEHARNTDARAVRLWTTNAQFAARRVYEKAGFSLRSSVPYTDFGADLVKEEWLLHLV